MHVRFIHILLAILLSCQTLKEDSERGVAINRVLVIGNSITYHPATPDIGWDGDWGMAASALEKDYCSLLEISLRDRYPTLDFRRENLYPFERHFDDLDFEKYAYLKEFSPDLLIIRLGENVDTDKLDKWNFSMRLQELAAYLTPGRIILTTTFWDNGLVNKQLLHAAENQGWDTVELSHLGEEERYMAIGEFENPEVARHPNDNGMKAIAEQILEVIWKKGSEKAATQRKFLK